MRDLLVIGSGGLGRELLWHIERINGISKEWNILGIIDDDKSKKDMIFRGHTVLGGCEELTKYPEAYVVCAVGAASVRKKIIDKVMAINPNTKFATIIDPSVIMSDSVKIGKGVVICASCVITVDVNIGDFTIINNACTIGHDAFLEDFVTLYPSVNVSGNTKIGACSELGVGMQIIQGKSIGKNTIVGAGAVVIRDLPDNCTAVGCPAKPIKFRD